MADTVSDDLARVRQDMKECKMKIEKIERELEDRPEGHPERAQFLERLTAQEKRLTILQDKELLIMQQAQETSSKRPRPDISYQYLKKMLEPEVITLPHSTALPTFIATLPAYKLPAQDTQYHMASVHPLAEQLLTPLSKVPDTFVLASWVSGVLRGELRDQAGENTLICDVDLLFHKLFKLAADASLLTFQSQRNPVDTLSGTTGKLLRPDYLLWVKNALLFKGDEKATALELSVALHELLSKLTSTWDSQVYGNCSYMIAYAVAGNLLSIHAIQPSDRGQLMQQELIDVDMSTVGGKLIAMLAVINILRLLRAMAKQLPNITWGIGQSINATDGGTTISTVTNMGSYVHKVVPHFKDSCGKYAPEGQDPLNFLKSVYASTKHAAHLVHALAEPKLRNDRFSVDLVPVGVAYSIPPQDVAEAKLAIKGVLQGCQELHAQGLVHRDLRWPNVVKVIQGDEHTIMLIDLELVGKADAVCNAYPYPLRHWGDGDDDSVLESDGRYTALSDLRMVGMQLMGALAFDLGTSGRDLQEKLQRGQLVDAAAALTHEWLTT